MNHPAAPDERLAGTSSMVDVLRMQEGIYDDDKIHDLHPLVE
jgi:hypothetical protein